MQEEKERYKRIQWNVILAMVGMAAVWLVTRGLWADCDPGIPSMWEYGYNATDEGYYLGGGKEKYLWGMFVDLVRGEALNYGFSPLTHWMSYLAHLVSGLSTWTWRIPFFAVNLAAWCALCGFLAKRIGGVWAFLSCVAFSISPMVVAYERTASNDVLIGSLLMLAFVAACSKRRFMIAVAALLAGAISLVKPSVWVLIPIVLAGIWSAPKFRSRLHDALFFLVGVVVTVAVLKGTVLLSVGKDAVFNGCSASDVVQRMTTHYPLPSLFAFGDHFRGLSSFPRDPSSVMLSFFAVLLVPIPVFFALSGCVRGKWSPRLLLYAAIPLYVAAISVMNTIYTHYFIPVLAILPLAWTWMREDIDEWAAECGKPLNVKRIAAFLAFALIVIGFAWLFISDAAIVPRSGIAAVQGVYSRVYNFPASCVWSHSVGGMLGTTAALVALAGAFCPVGRWKFVLPAVAASAVVAGSVVMAFLPAAQLAPYMHRYSDAFVVPALLSFALFTLVAAGSAAFPALLARKGVWFALPAVFVLLGYVLTPVWRQSATELCTLRTHFHRDAARALADLLPKDAVVIGERSNQMMMSLPVRTATTFAFNSNPIPVVEALQKREPATPLYALVDTQHAYNLQHYREHANEYRLDIVGKFQMPSFGDGKPSDLFLCRIARIKQN